MIDPTAREGICYSRNYLSQVIFRVDFAADIELFNRTLPQSIKEAAVRRFPIPEPRQQQALAFSLGIVGGQPIPPAQEMMSSKKVRNWVFHNETKTRSIDISQSAIVLSITAYDRFEESQEEFMSIVGPVFREFPDLYASRLGLRFINLIRLDEENPLDWKEYLHERLLTRLSTTPKDGGKIIRDMHSMEVRFDDCLVRFQSGMANPDYPAPIRRKEFTLDIDAHNSGLFSYDELSVSLKQFHLRVQDYFEMSITDSLRDLMNAHQ